MNKPSALRLASLIAPLVSVFIAIALIVFQVHRRNALNDERAQITQQIAALDRLAREIQVRPVGRKVAVVPPSPNEQPLFLNMLRGFADNSRVQLTKYDNKTVPPPASGSADAKTTLLPPGVIALTSNVEVAGGYNGVRQFMYDLWRSQRLFNTTDLRWVTTDKWPSTHLAFTLTRYVYGTVPAPPAAPRS